MESGVIISKIVVTFEGELWPEIDVEGQPIPYSARKGKYGKFYKPKRLLEFQSNVASAGLEAVLQTGRTSLETEHVAVISRFTRKGKAKCDADNLQKSVQDALTGVVYADDVQVHALAVTKESDDQPRSKILVMTLANVTVEVEDDSKRRSRSRAKRSGSNRKTVSKKRRSSR